MFTLGEFSGLERTVVLKELILNSFYLDFNSFYFARVWQS